MEFVKRFLNEENGAVTVDWVVLTALIVALAGAAFSGIDGGVATLTSSIMTYLQGLTVGA
ncbi:MAG: hypothetical protein AAGA05_12505 [Pseudomonadota bacterium]